MTDEELNELHTPGGSGWTPYEIDRYLKREEAYWKTVPTWPVVAAVLVLVGIVLLTAGVL